MTPTHALIGDDGELLLSFKVTRNSQRLHVHVNVSHTLAGFKGRNWGPSASDAIRAGNWEGVVCYWLGAQAVRDLHAQGAELVGY